MGDKKRRRKRKLLKHDIVSIPISWQELNYIDSGLRKSIQQHEESIARHGILGNEGDLLAFCKKTQKRLQRLHEQSRRKLLGEKKWKEVRGHVNKIMREARKKYPVDKVGDKR